MRDDRAVQGQPRRNSQKTQDLEFEYFLKYIFLINHIYILKFSWLM